MSKYSNDLDGELDRLVFLHEDRSPNPSDWCCLREPSVREAVKELLEQTRTNTIDAAIAVLPEKKTLQTDLDDANIADFDEPSKFCVECGQYEFEGQLNCPCTGFNSAIDETLAALIKLKKG